MVYIGWYGFIGPTTSMTDISLGYVKPLENLIDFVVHFHCVSIILSVGYN